MASAPVCIPLKEQYSAFFNEGVSMKTRILSAVFTIRFAAGLLVITTVCAGEIQLDRITVPSGFTISVYAQNMTDARSMAMGPGGVLFVGNRKGDKVWAVTDTNHDKRGDKVTAVISGLTSPNGVAFLEKDLYVAERSRILRYADIEDHLGAPPQAEVVYSALPDDSIHGWKYLAFGPDGYLYLPVGAPCNVCLQQDVRYASIARLKPDGTGFSVFAHGIRNTVGFDWHPVTKQLWFTDNGRDNMGDDIPSDELNMAADTGMHFGFPFCHEGSVADPDFGAQAACSEFTPTKAKLGAHVAALGMKFYTGTMFPEQYRNRIFIAEHGSWNRSKKVGYRIVMVELEGDSVRSHTVFAEGWLQNESAWGRPVDLLVASDGALLVSDDLAGAVYRIEYTPVTKVGSVFQDKSGHQERSAFTSVHARRTVYFDILGKPHAASNLPPAPMLLVDPTAGRGGRFIIRGVANRKE